jgi:hypothetical protein
MLGGGGVGGGELRITEADGKKWTAPVSLTSGTLGVMIAADNNGGDLTIDFAPGDVKDGTDLLGTYQGVEWNVALAFGAGGYDLENEQFVRLHGTVFAEALGMYVGHTWLGVDVDGAVLQAK